MYHFSHVIRRVLAVVERFTGLIPLTEGQTKSHIRQSFTTTAQIVNIGQQQSVTFSTSDADLTGDTASITIPHSVVSELTSGQTLRFSHSVYFNDSLFVSSPPVQLGSVVLATSVVGGFNVTNFKEPITLTFRKTMVGE